MRTTKIQESLALLQRIGLPIDDLLDVGVQTSTPVLMELFPNHTHHLFEPVDDYFPAIAKNYAAIPHKLVHAAVSDSDGEVMLHSEKKMGDGKISHSWITEKATAATRRVQALTLDSYVERSGAKAPFLLKVDVDGAHIPASILRGASRTLQQCSVVVIEMTVDRFHERATLLDAAGFDIWDIASLCYYGSCLWQFDAIYVHRGYKRRMPALQPMHVPPFQPVAWQQG